MNERVDFASQPSSARIDVVIDAFRDQVHWYNELGAPFTHRLLKAALADHESGGWLTRRIGDWSGNPIADALPLRVAGALHALVLGGRAPALARHYPPSHTDRDDSLWPTAVAVLQANTALLDDYLARAPQTNEIGRAALLYAGFSSIAARRAQPLRLLEIGASAGLNMQWDRYRYRLGAAARGDPLSAVEIQCDWAGALPPDVAINVRDRRGCDLAPIDLADPAQRLRLRSYVWPDQPQRLARLDGAIELALNCGLVQVDAEDAAAWVPAQLARPMFGFTTVVYQRVVWMYLPAPVREALGAAIKDAGQRATDANPLAWLSFEFPARSRPAELRLTEWPGGATRTLAHAHPHGRWVRWLPMAN